MFSEKLFELLRFLKINGGAEFCDTHKDDMSLTSMDANSLLVLILEAEKVYRENNRIINGIRRAKLRYDNALPGSVNYRHRRNLDRDIILPLCQCIWVSNFQHILIAGPSGVGKSWLACMFGRLAIQKGYSVIYKRLPRLLEEFEAYRVEGTLAKNRLKLSKFRVLILDDWAIAPLSTRGRQDLLEVIEDRSDRGSLIITSQLPIKNWHNYIGEPTIADAIIDRIVHNAHKLELKGDTLRKSVKPDEETTR